MIIQTTLSMFLRQCMKYIVIILITAVFSCKSGKNTSVNVLTDKILVHYSKGSCLGKCPVYDVWIYQDGSVSYLGIRHVSAKRNIKTKLEEKEFRELKTMLNKGIHENMSFKKVRDLPITTLRYNGKEHKYHSSKVDGMAKELNMMLENIVYKISAKSK